MSQLGLYTAFLAGKIVVDIANPADFSTFDPTTEPGTSAAEQVAAEAPRARVVKAFSTTFADTLVAGQVNGQPLDVFITGEDADPTKTIADLASSGALNPSTSSRCAGPGRWKPSRSCTCPCSRRCPIPGPALSRSSGDRRVTPVR